MYDDQTYLVILNRMIKNAVAEYKNADTREGSIIHLAEAPAAVEFQNVYIELERILEETFATTCSRASLIERCRERGLAPHQATNAIFRGQFNVELTIGDRFALEDYTYVVVDYIQEKEYQLQCEQVGSSPNSTLGTLIPLTYIDGLENAELVECLVPGEDEEATEDLRTRYFASMTNTAFGGNVADYKEKTNALAGVGATKVVPTWNGGGTVKLVILDSEYKVPSETLVTFVQNEVDPNVEGAGNGFAPIGHKVTVVGATEVPVAINATLTYQNGYSWADVKTNVENAIDTYFLELKQAWEDTDCIVRVTRVEQAILSAPGVVDITNTKINGDDANINLSKEEIPVRGDIVVV